ncbi:MAG: phospho-N-acetylmuramoyl-pentapeptide-transferase [Deltaproteobacteria bacterium]|nr:phospho-N-acetylmuramoyl-pentapeptide-transferase [Deltaproteobacteria bacterium]
MIYYLLYPLSREHAWLSFLNVLRYVPFRIVAATMTALLLSFALYPWFIERLKRRQIGQVVRADGPESHFSKKGTPTMGGSMILLTLVIPSVLWADPSNALVWMALAVTVGYGLIGFYDDYRKIKKRHSGGLAGRYKLLGQFAIAIGVCAFLWYGKDGLAPDWILVRDRLAVPFLAFSKHPISIPPWAYVGFASMVIVATSNAVNLTDGLDGLAIGPVIVNSGTYLVLAYATGATFAGAALARYLDVPEEVRGALSQRHVAFSFARYLDIPAITSAAELSIVCGALIGAGFGFLWYNSHPAQVFMGDVGSLAIGGTLGTIAVLTKNELLSIVVGGIFVVEAVSVIVQVGYFKLTKKRIFLMAPIHHHFEKKGWPETKVVIRFWTIAIMLALIAIASLKLR